MPEDFLKQQLGLGRTPPHFWKKFQALEKEYEQGKITLEELSILSEIDIGRLKKYFSQKPQDFLCQKTVLVCGGAGFIGSNFVHYILGKYPNYRVINYDKLTYAGNLDNLRGLDQKENYTFIRGDIADRQKLFIVFEKYSPEFVINFAAETHVGRSVFLGAQEFVRTNVLGVVILLEAVKKYRPQKFVHISTDEVFGTLALDEPISFTEESSFLPNVPYAASKAGGDLMCRAFYQSFKIPVIVTHCTNNYGPYQYPEKVIPFWILRALKREPLPVHGKGEHVRDWLFVEEHCQALDLILHKGSPGQVYNIAGQNERSILEVARQVLKIMGRPFSLIKFIKDRPGNDLRYSLDISKIKKDLSWQPQRKFEQTLPQVVDWYISNQWWLDNIFKRAKKFNAYVGHIS